MVLVNGCEEIIDLDLPHENRRLIVDAILTDKDEPCYVRLSYTQKYSYACRQDPNAVIPGALVIIHEVSGVSDTLTEVSRGIYESHPEILKGSIGNSYQLEIKTEEGIHYTSDEETMLDVPDIDSMYFERDPDDISPDNPDYYRFNVYINWKDPEETRNFYVRKFSYFWSGIWHDNILWNWVFNDKYFDGNYLTRDLITSDYGGVGFKIKVEQFSLTKSAYDFWLLVHKQTIRADNPRVNSLTPLVGNVYNINNPDDYALGYFQVSATSSIELWIDE